MDSNSIINLSRSDPVFISADDDEHTQTDKTNTKELGYYAGKSASVPEVSIPLLPTGNDDDAAAAATPTKVERYEMSDIESQNLRQSMQNVTDSDINELKNALIRYAPKSKENDLQMQGVKALAIEALANLEELRKNELTMHQGCCSKEGLKYAAEGVLFSVLCVLATINLLGITGDADFSKPAEAFSKLMSLPAAVSTGCMYTGGALNIYDGVMNWVKDNINDGGNKLQQFKSAITSTLKQLDLKTSVKSFVVLPVAIWSVVLDARNTQVGTFALLKNGMDKSSANHISKLLAVGNGFTEALLPLVTLPQLFDTIAAPICGIVYGKNHTEAQLGELSQLLKGLMFENGSSIEDAKALSKHISKHVSEMSHSQRARFKDAMIQIAQNKAGVMTELTQYINNESTESNSNRIKSFATLLLQISSMTVTMWTIGMLVSQNQKVEYYMGELGNRNLTMDGLKGNMPDNTTIAEMYGIQPFDTFEDVINVGSYACQGIALYPYVLFTMQMVLETAKIFIPGAESELLAQNPVIKKLVIGLTCALIGSGAYAYKLTGAAQLGDILRNIEETLGIEDTSLLPDFDGLPTVAIVCIVLTLFGGAFNGARTIYNHLPISLCARDARVVTDLEVQYSDRIQEVPEDEEAGV